MTGLRAGAATDVGLVRSNNQDQLLLAYPLFAVADGMGGHAAGEVASLTAVQALRQAFEGQPARSPESLVEAGRAANRAVWDRASADRELLGMGTTLVAVALVERDGREELSVINVGDSRLYRLHQGELSQLTIDHSLVQELVSEGQLAVEDVEFHPQRHVLTRALGVDPDVRVDLFEIDPEPGDRLLLCSDGLSKEVSDDLVASVLRRLVDPNEAARELVNLANERGGNDNVTVVIVDVVGDGPEPGDASSADATLVADGGLPVIPLESRERAKTPTARLLTGRVVVFIVVFVVLVGSAAAGIGWYARGSYYVGLQGSTLIIYQGRPGGLLWFKPTIARRTTTTTADVLPSHLSDLQAGHEEGSLSAAGQYVANLEVQYHQAQEADQPPATSTTTTPGSPGSSSP